ncbi:MAG: methionyl-tRNA formyltransferase, partial [Oscillospiraceae bacterium]
MRVVFMGTPDFAEASLRALIEVGYEICGVFTQPDKPKNRGKQVVCTPVKEYALEKGLEVFQPLSLRKGDDAVFSLEKLRELNPDVIVVAAYGQILPKEILELPKYGCVNVHASLLPKYRGAAPIQRCIQDGETKSGVCIMRMEEGLDTGDVIVRREVEISTEMTGSELWNTLSAVGGETLIDALKQLENGTATYTKQEGESCYAKMITKEELRIDFTKSAKSVYDFIRAMADVPCAYTLLEGKRLKVFRAKMNGKMSKLPAGTVANVKTFSVACGDGECVEF